MNIHSDVPCSRFTACGIHGSGTGGMKSHKVSLAKPFPHPCPICEGSIHPPVMPKDSGKGMPDRATSVVSVAVVGDMERPQPLVSEPAGRVQRLQSNKLYNSRPLSSERETVS